MDKMTLAAAVAGAVAMAGQMSPVSAADASKGKEKCYGVAVAGENGCASADGSHACAGMSTIDYSGQEWVVVEGGTCEKMGGKFEPFQGIGKPPEKAPADKSAKK
jgi:uncharacterized membrane protein